MRTVVIPIFMLFFSGAVMADSVKIAESVKKISDSVWGDFELTLQEKPLQKNPNQLNVTILCKDRRAMRNSVQPVKEQVLSEGVCDYNGYSFDERESVLTIHFSTMATPVPPSKETECGERWQQSFDLKLLCDGWKP